MKKLLFSAAIAALTFGAAPASANTVLIKYYSVVAGGDFDSTCCNEQFNNSVLAALGLNGLPVANVGYGGPVLNGVDPMTGELTWWTPSASVTATGTSIVNIPFNDSTFFVPNGTGTDNVGGPYLTAVLAGNIIVPTAQNVSFTFGGDDDVFAFIDGSAVARLGGVHGFTSTNTSTFLTAGTHSLRIFFADRHEVASRLQVRLNTQGVSIDAIPEPATWAMLIGGFGMVGAAMRRQKRPTTVTA